MAPDVAAPAPAVQSRPAEHKPGWVEEYAASKFGVQLLSYARLPAWLRDNEYIRSGYRPPLKSFVKCFESLLYVHNETCNVYTHLVGLVIFAALLVYGIASGWITDGSFLQGLSLVVFFTGTLAMLLFSTLFHLVFCHSPSAHSLFSRLDYTGIALMIAGSFFPSIYHVFFCRPGLQIMYMSMICVFGAGCVVVSLMEKFATPEWRMVRMLLFLSMGCSGLLPAIHTAFIYDWDHIYDAFAVGSHALMGLLYVGGALVYGLRLPERLRPGWFDIFGHSHQFFHVCVVIAAVSHYRAIVSMKAWRMSHPCLVQ
ncbi:uncharacterized protein AMSG_01244 [Thecamonas trahens ATCC 50062]|uniref:Adiponectin receptor protein 1 n=1 Tax=Thecamonas trahens ATCC 50062 TaxID=461836 RepID=A0A0L0DND5_THETB|nr:hypothetical protein AMSG_01244 [Thecamonas trahens ATCC 50062]KNC53531.1 hypothetical protein AMSG_01244 [Thecamonas trahens ATCC 50062]|eukprot:XP_013761852.1 hypothetical protein AMSG_01244 [Thecamonas trahens ATCC 50062]